MSTDGHANLLGSSTLLSGQVVSVVCIAIGNNLYGDIDDV